MTVLVYPRLYTSRIQGGDGVIVSQGDESVELLYRTLIDRTTNTNGWPFWQSVLINACRLFGDIRDWFQDQASNPNLVGYNRRFLADTLDFIERGTRELPLSTWSDLLQEGGIGHHAHAIPQRMVDTKVLLLSSDDSLRMLQKWISQHNGFEDMLVTMHLLFGKARNS